MKRLLFILIMTVFLVNTVFAIGYYKRWERDYSTNVRYITDTLGDTLQASVDGISWYKYYNITHYGASNDSTDMKSAFQSVLDEMRSDGDYGGVIYFPPGIYRLSDSITIPIDTLERLTIASDHNKATIYIEGTGGFYITDTTATGKTGVEITGLKFKVDTTSSTAQEFAIQLYKVGLLKIQDIWIEGSAYLDKGIQLVGSQQGYIKGGYINKCVEALVFDSSVDAAIYSNGVHVSGLTITGQSAANEYTRAVRYSGSHTGTLIGNHFTNCSTLVEVNSGYALNIISNHFETSQIGLNLTGGSNTTVRGNMFSESNVYDLYVEGGNKNNITGGNLFNGQIMFGAGTSKNFFGFNTLSDTLFDSTVIAGDSSNYNTFMPSETQGNGYGPTGIRVTTNTNDPLDFYMYSTAGPFTGRLIGTDSTYLAVSGIGSNVPFGFKFESAGLTVGKIEGNTSTSNGLRFYTNNGSNVLTERLKIAGAADKPLITFSNLSGLKVGEYTLDTADGTNGQALVTDGSGNVAFSTISGSAVWDVGDSVIAYQVNDSVIYFTYDDDTTWMKSENSVLVLGAEGQTIIDSVGINGRVVFHTASDSIVFPQSNPTDNYILVYDAAGDSLAWEAQTGGSGTVDSTRIGFGLENLSQAQDSLASPTDTIQIDTSTIATVGHAENYADTIVGDSLTAYFDTAQVVDTIQALISGGGGSALVTEENGTTELSATDTLNFTGVFTLTNSGDGQVNVYIDTTNDIASKGHAENYADTAIGDSLGDYLNLGGGEMTGNITFSGSQTVDGIDLSTIPTVYEIQLDNEAGLYAVLSDVSDFLQLSDTGATVANGSAVIVTANAIYDWAIANGWQALADSADGVSNGTALFVTSNAVYDYIAAQGFITGNETITLSGDVSGSGTTSITTTIGTGAVDTAMLNYTEINEHIADVAGAMVSGNSESGIAVTYQDGDNTLDFAVQNVSSSMILNQTIVRADMDTTASDFVFDDAYKGTSGVPDSILITRRELDDSLDAVRSENAGLFQPIGHGDADSLKGVPIPNTPTTGDDGKGLTYFETGDTLGWVAYPSQAYVDSVGEAADNDTITGIVNLVISGDLGSTGAIWEANSGNLLNLELANALYPSTALLDLQCVDSSGADLDSSWAVHPSNLYLPDGILWDRTKKKMMAYTPLEAEEDENPHIVWAEAGTDNWLPIYNGSDSLTNPVFEPSDFTGSTHISDPDLFSDFDENIWLIFRVTYGSDSEVIKISQLDTSAAGVPQMSTPVSILATSTAGSYLSPSIIKDTNSTYTLFTVEPNTNGGLDSSRVVRYVNDGTKLDSVGAWNFKDTCSFPYSVIGTDTLRPWHIEVIPRGIDELLALVVMDPTGDGASVADTTSLILATSYDRGATWGYGDNPSRLLTPWDDTSAYYGRIMYRSSGTWVDDGSGGYLDMYVSAKGPYHSSTNWYIFHTKLFFNNANIAATSSEISDSLNTYIATNDTKNRTVLLECSDVVGRRDIPATDSVRLSLRTMYDASTPVLLQDTSYDVGTSPYYDTLRFVWDALPQDLVSVDSIIFTFIETGISGVADLFVYGQKTASVMADSAYTSDLTSNVTASSWTRQAIYVGNSDFAGGEQLSALMRIFLASNNSLWIGRMYLKCTVQYTY